MKKLVLLAATMLAIGCTEPEAVPEPEVPQIQESVPGPYVEPPQEPALDETRLVFELSWQQMTPRERNEFCRGVEVIGPQESADRFDSFDRDTMLDILEEVCPTP